MTMICTNIMGRCDAQIDALKAEFGAVLAARILDAEAAEFLWDARVRERYLGQHIGETLSDDGPAQDVSRVAFLSLLDGRWYAGISLIDGEGFVEDLLLKQAFSSFDDAQFAFVDAR